MGLFDDDEPDDPLKPLKVVRSYLALAIQIGAPAYNGGDQRGCYEVYACTARLLLQAVKGADGAKAQLREALERCATTVDVGEQAWIMRHAFDAILNDVEDN
jgi:hypothetical protein